jgi:hypothetical protein
MIKREGKHTRAGTPRKQLKSAKASPPKWDTPEWIKWKVRQMKKAFSSGDLELYTRAWEEFETLLMGLLKDGEFWNVSNVLPLLPPMLAARQEIDLMNRYYKRMYAGMKAAETRKARAAAS